MSRAGRIGAVLLAAGASSRMGEPKQLLRWGAASLLEHATDTLLATGCGPVVVVLGHEASRMRQVLGTRPVRVVEPADWQRGPGASLRAGAAHAIETAPALEGLLVTLGDQPRVRTSDLLRLLEAFEAARPAIVAARYAGTRGVPLILCRQLLAGLDALDPASGARALIAGAEPDVISLDLPEAADDLDTPEAYARLAPLRR